MRKTGAFPGKYTPAERSMVDLLRAAPAAQQMLWASLGPSGVDLLGLEVWRGAEKELQCGWARGPWHRRS